MSRIIIIGPAHPLRGGLATFNQRLAKEFIDTGHDCSIYSFALQYPSFLFPGKTQYSDEPAPKEITIHTGNVTRQNVLSFLLLTMPDNSKVTAWGQLTNLYRGPRIFNPSLRIIQFQKIARFHLKTYLLKVAQRAGKVCKIIGSGWTKPH